MTISGNAAFSGSYDYGEVARSILIAVAGSYAALDLAGRLTAASGRARWLAGGAIAMGIGIWEMHFKGLLALRLPVPVAYYWPDVLASFVVAGFASGTALYIVSRQSMGPVRFWAGGLIMGSGIAGSHYIDKAAMRLAAVCRYDLRIVILSVVIAIVFSLVALILAFGVRETRERPWRRIASALVMGAAISVMHYTGMASATFIALPVVPNLSHSVSISPLANAGVAMITLLVIGAAIVTSSEDRRATAEARRISERLEGGVAERTGKLDAVNQALRKEIAERERTEQSLRLFRMLIDQSNDAIEVIDPETLRIIDANEKACIDLGYSREELLSLSVFDIDPSVDESVVAKVTGELRDSGSTIFEGVHKRKDGSTFPVEISLREVQFDRNYRVSVARDISERKHTEEALRKSEERFRLAGQAGRMFAYEWDAGTDTITRSAEASRILGIDGATPPTGGQAMAVIHPGDEERVKASLVKLTAEKPDLRIDYRMIRPDGTVIWVERNSRARFDTQGRLLRVVGMITDITERKRAEAELRESEARFRLVADSAPVMIWMSGTDKLCTYFNKPWLDFTGRSIEQELGHGWAEAVHPEDLGRCMGTYMQFFDRRERFQMEYRLQRHDGEFRWVSDIGVPRSNPDGSFAGFIGSCIDVTERIRADERVRESQAELARLTRIAAQSELTASIAHEINQPLAAVATNASASLRWLAMQPPSLDEAREAASRAIQEANRASGVIARIRALFQKAQPQLRALDGNEAIREALLLAEGDLLRAGVTVKTELAADAPPVLGDRVQIQQVILNLVLNAIEAMSTITERPRELFIKSAKHPDGQLIQVQDSGKGLDPEHSGRIFEPFFTTKPQGIGMGLSISRSIVEAHGGQLWFTPGPEHGAIFRLLLPKERNA